MIDMVNNYVEIKSKMSKVANDNSVPLSVWMMKFLKIGAIVSITLGVFFVLS